jgi:hypothetical protein
MTSGHQGFLGAGAYNFEDDKDVNNVMEITIHHDFPTVIF